MSDFFTDIYTGDFQNKINGLASMAPEEWNLQGETDNKILKNYINYTYQRLCEEGKVVKDPSYALFNTGLFTEYYEPIYAYLEVNTAGGSQPYYLKKFTTPYDLGAMGISELPDRANYFQQPELLVFDASCPINVQYKHILSDPNNVSRIPNGIRGAKNLQYIVSGAIDIMKKKVTANYKIAVPQYFSGQIQLLLPLCLEDPSVPDLALVVTKNGTGNFYQGHTCLTLEMAYNNARLIAKPESNWLKV